MITVTFEILIFCPSLNLPPAFVINSFFWRNVIHVCLETWNPRNINQEKAWCKAGSSFFLHKSGGLGMQFQGIFGYLVST